MRSTGMLPLVALLAVFLSPACGSAQGHNLHLRKLLQDASIQDAGTSTEAVQPTDSSVQQAPTVHPADALGASVGPVIPPVTASAADIAAAAAVGGRLSRQPSLIPILEVAGDSPAGVATAAVAPAQTTTITIYQQCNFGGSAGVASVGNYPTLPAPFENSISSLRVPAGLQVTLRENRFYGGRGTTITGPANIKCLSNRRFNGITSSMRVIATSSGGTRTSPGGTSGSGGIDTQLLNLVNAVRRQNGLSDLSINARLNAAAQAHSQDQARTQTMSHTGSDGSTFDVRITRAGYRWMTAAENVAAGYTSVQSVFNGWMGSPGHRQNILGNFVHMGVGMATGANDWPYWTQEFGTPA